MSETATEPAQTGYTPPATQADLDRIIADRVARERGKYADYDDLKAKAARLDTIEASAKTELEKAIEGRTAAEQLAASLEAENKRLAVIARHQIPDDYASLIKGDTEEDLEKAAAQVAALIASKTPDPAAPQRLVIPSEGKTPPALNSSALEDSLRKAVGAPS